MKPGHAPTCWVTAPLKWGQECSSLGCWVHWTLCYMQRVLTHATCLTFSFVLQDHAASWILDPLIAANVLFQATCIFSSQGGPGPGGLGSVIKGVLWPVTHLEKNRRSLK